MEIKIIQNAVIIEVIDNAKVHNFFLDSGVPYSFSNSLSRISNKHIGTDIAFNLNLRKPYVNISGLEEYLGIKLSGFLALDFIEKFESFTINLGESKIELNTPFESDFSLPLLSTNPLTTSISVDDKNNKKVVVIDVGSMESMLFNLNGIDNKYQSSKGWSLPSAFGKMDIDYYSDIPLFFDNINLGNFTFGHPRNLPQMFPFEYFLGLSFVRAFVVNINLKNRTLDLKRTSKINDKIYRLNSKMRTLGFQLVYENNEFIVSNVLDGFEDIEVKINDKISFNNPVDLDSFYNSILAWDEDENISLKVNGKDIVLRTRQAFT